MSTTLRSRDATAMVRAVKEGATTVAATAGTLWVVSVVNWVVFGGWLSTWAIHPRTVDGLLGILFAPFLHGSMGHLVANTIGLVLLAPLTMLRKRMDFWVVSAAGTVSAGLGAWLLGGAGTVHLGASGVIFAYLGFLMARGFFERSVGAVLLSIVVTWLFGSMVWGIFPVLAGAGISWQAHLFGFLGGVGTARLLGRQLRRSR